MRSMPTLDTIEVVQMLFLKKRRIENITTCTINLEMFSVVINPTLTSSLLSVS